MTEINPGPFSVRSYTDSDVKSTVVQLSYSGDGDPSRAIDAWIAPNLGSNFYRFRVGKHDLLHYDLEQLMAMDFTGNFVLWPMPNRLRGRAYTYNGQAYSLESIVRNQGNWPLIHGLVFDRSWSRESMTSDANGAYLTTRIQIASNDPLFSSYPFPSELTLTYSLNQTGIRIGYAVTNLSETTLPFGFALHPYFSTLQDPGTTVSIPARTVMEADDDLLPTGRLLDVTSIMYSMFNLNDPVPVRQLKLDHVYTDLEPATALRITYPLQSLSLDLTTSSEFSHAVIYTLGGSTFFCLENQTCSTDALNLHAKGLTKEAHLLELAAGDTASGFIMYTTTRSESN